MNYNKDYRNINKCSNNFVIYFQEEVEDSYDSCSEPEYQSLIKSNDYDDDDDDDEDDVVCKCLFVLHVISVLCDIKCIELDYS